MMGVNIVARLLGFSSMGSSILVECFHAPDFDLNSLPSEARYAVVPSSFSILRALLIIHHLPYHVDML